MAESLPRETIPEYQKQSHYGWVIVAACTLMIAVTYGVMYSYSVFFKPLADYFSWDRATVSIIYSASLVIRGAISIGTGWLADKYGAKKLMIFCGLMMALGLILCNWVQELWQLFLAYAIVESIGLSGAFGIGSTLVARWFTQKRGLAIGIVSTGSGLGTLFIVPGTERLIAAVDWQQSFLIFGIVAGVFVIAAALFLRPAPYLQQTVIDTDKSLKMDSGQVINLFRVLRDPRMGLLLGIFMLFFFCNQVIMVHLVNYATDIGITPLVAATFISIIGAVSIAGRLTTGAASDKIGINNTLILTHIFLVISFIYLIFTHSLWSFYIFTVIFGFTYGAEVPLISLFVGKFFGTRNMATLLGLILFIGNIGGALGPWVAGKIFDTTQSYHWAFIAGAVGSAVSLVLALMLKKQCQNRSLKR